MDTYSVDLLGAIIATRIAVWVYSEIFGED